MDRTNAAGASGNWPRMAWLPMITSSCCSAIRPAARIKCSRSERCIHPFPLVGGEHAREWRGLPQPRSTFSRIRNDVSDLRPWPLEDGVPFVQCTRHGVFVSRTPSPQSFLYLLQKRGFELDLLRYETVHGQAACFDDAML